jgi:GT2 family glycosyltransferase
VTGDPSVAAVVVNYNGGAVTRTCIDSLRRGSGPPVRVVVADNASRADERAELERAYTGADDVEFVWLSENRHFAGGVNAGTERALAIGASHVLVLNNDTEIAPDCVKWLVAAADAMPDAGVVGPALLDLTSREPLSLGERYAPWCLAAPRTWLRVRSAGDGLPYRVGGVMGSALLVTRECFERVGPYREDLLVYYEEVDFCLRARALGYAPLIEPRAVVLHDGMRGFAAGLTPYAARLKTRNLLLLMRAHGAGAAWITFAPTYAGLVIASAALYGLRGQWSVVRALLVGVREGFGGALAATPRWAGSRA